MQNDKSPTTNKFEPEQANTEKADLDRRLAKDVAMRPPELRSVSEQDRDKVSSIRQAACARIVGELVQTRTLLVESLNERVAVQKINACIAHLAEVYLLDADAFPMDNSIDPLVVHDDEIEGI